MRFSHQQLTLWYGTPDAPGPAEGSVQPRRGPALTVAVQPPGPSNVVMVRYRVDEGPLQSVRAVRTWTDFAQGVEYHRVVFPDFRTGERVCYVPILSCAGRSAPDAESVARLPSTFRLAVEPLSPPPADSIPPPGSAHAMPPPDRLPYAVEYLASATVPLKDPEVIGETPAGLLLNWYWYPDEGEVSGPKLNAKIRRLGGDWMTIRRDGIAVIDVRATLETRDGALIYVNHVGYLDLGESGYRDFLSHRLPDRAPTRTTPRFHTTHASYLWLNRLTCFGIGQVHMKELLYVYDLYAVR